MADANSQWAAAEEMEAAKTAEAARLAAAEAELAEAELAEEEEMARLAQMEW